MPLFIVNDAQLIGSLSYKKSLNTTCSICREELNQKSIYAKLDEKSNILVGTCNHGFHYECISAWLKNNKNCPLCNCQFISK
uniref:RING-H2 zinc finger domain protein n=1 Tax=Megaviridae environmental sample TaxID=1737588 RepID=A0A5J6VK89_9VIRU|nr:MAG: RING-H2 zinc finger domain protein [Megaviridae environmental sample]